MKYIILLLLFIVLAVVFYCSVQDKKEPGVHVKATEHKTKVLKAEIKEQKEKTVAQRTTYRKKVKTLKESLPDIKTFTDTSTILTEYVATRDSIDVTKNNYIDTLEHNLVTQATLYDSIICLDSLHIADVKASNKNLKRKNVLLKAGIITAVVIFVINLFR